MMNTKSMKRPSRGKKLRVTLLKEAVLIRKRNSNDFQIRETQISKNSILYQIFKEVSGWNQTQQTWISKTKEQKICLPCIKVSSWTNWSVKKSTKQHRANTAQHQEALKNKSKQNSSCRQPKTRPLIQITNQTAAVLYHLTFKTSQTDCHLRAQKSTFASITRSIQDESCEWSSSSCYNRTITLCWGSTIFRRMKLTRFLWMKFSTRKSMRFTGSKCWGNSERKNWIW